MLKFLLDLLCSSFYEWTCCAQVFMNGPVVLKFLCGPVVLKFL